MNSSQATRAVSARPRPPGRGPSGPAPSGSPIRRGDASPDAQTSGSPRFGELSSLGQIVKAEAQALAEIQDESARIASFETLISEVLNDREEYRAATIHMLLMQLPVLPPQACASALISLLSSCDEAAAEHRPRLYAALARCTISIPEKQRFDVLRRIVGAPMKRIDAPKRGPALTALAASLSLLPDAQAQTRIFNDLQSLLGDARQADQKQLMEALTKVTWHSAELRLASCQAILKALPNVADDQASGLLVSLVDILVLLPQEQQHAEFNAILNQACRLEAAHRQAPLRMLRAVVPRLPGQVQKEATDALNRAGAPLVATAAGPGAAAGGAALIQEPVSAMNNVTFLSVLHAAAPRSPAHQAAALTALAARLDELPCAERADAFAKLLRTAAALPAPQRTPVLLRLIAEFGQIEASARPLAWKTLLELERRLSGHDQAQVLAAMCAGVADLEQSSRLTALASLFTCARIAAPDATLAAALGAAIAHVDDAQRLQAFSQALDSLRAMPGAMQHLLCMGLADALTLLPPQSRLAAAAQLTERARALPSGQRTELLLRLAATLACMPRDALIAMVTMLIERMAPDKENMSQLLCAIAGALPEFAEQNVSYLACMKLLLEAAVPLALERWLDVVEATVPLLLRDDLPAPVYTGSDPKLLKMEEERVKAMFGVYSLDRFGPHVLMNTCAIIRSGASLDEKDMMLRHPPESHWKDAPDYFLRRHPGYSQRGLAFLVPMLGSGLDEAFVVQHVQPWIPQKNGMLVRTFLKGAISESRDDKTFRLSHTIFRLLLGSALSLEAKHSILEHQFYYPVAGKYSTFYDLVFSSGSIEWPPSAFRYKPKDEHEPKPKPEHEQQLDCMHELIKFWISEIAHSPLPIEIKETLLAGRREPAPPREPHPTFPREKTRQKGDAKNEGGEPNPFEQRIPPKPARIVLEQPLAEPAQPDTAVILALRNGNRFFLQIYCREIAHSPLPEQSKVALIGGRNTERSNSAAINAILKKLMSSNKTIIDAYTEIINSLPLAPASKQELLLVFL